MNLVLAPLGSRGDVQPMIALGLMLQARGHTVTICAPATFADWISGLDLPFRPACEDFKHLFDRPDEIRVTRHVARAAGPIFTALRAACQGADALVGAMLQIAGPSIAELLNIPYLYAIYVPTFGLRTSHYPPAGTPWKRLPSWINRFAWSFGEHLWTLLWRQAINRERAALGLAPIDSVAQHMFHSGRMLVAVDAALAPLPPDAKGEPVVTGFWFLDAGDRLDADLEAFLAAGPAPIYVGFGSMTVPDPAQLTGTILEALRLTGHRAIISEGWAGLGKADLPASCRIIGAAPHLALFPRMAAVVHHGGAGTTAAAAHAGIPQVIVPHFGDQYYWGYRIEDLGLGVPPIPIRRLSPARLARAIEVAVSDPAMRKASCAMAQRIRRSQGVLVAAQTIEAAVAAAAGRGMTPV